MGIQSWRLNTALTTILFLSASLELVQERCDRDRFCDQYDDGSVLVEKENIIHRGQRRTNLDDQRENTRQRAGREDVTRDRLLRAEWHSEPRSVVGPRDLVDDRLRMKDGRQDNRVDFSNDNGLFIDNGRKRLLYPKRGQELDLERQARREVQRTGETELQTERREEAIREKQLQRREDHLEMSETQSRNRFYQERKIHERNHEELLKIRRTESHHHPNQEETLPERFNEDHVQQYEKQDRREDSRELADRIEARSRVAANFPVSRNLEESSKFEQREEEDRETIRTDRSDLSLEQLEDEMRDRGRRLNLRENSMRLITRRDLESDRQEDSRQRQTRRLEECADHIERVDSRRSISREESREHGLYRQSSRIRVGLSRRENRREGYSRERLGEENSRRFITREETVQSDRSEGSRGYQTDQLKERNDRNPEKQSRSKDRRENSQNRINREASSRGEQLNENSRHHDDQEDSSRDFLRERRERLTESFERREERSRKDVPKDRLKHALDRLSSQREDLSRSIDRQENSQELVNQKYVRRFRKEETIRSEQREDSKDFAKIENSRPNLLREKRQRLNEPTERIEERWDAVSVERREQHEERSKEDFQTGQRSFVLNRLSNQQRKELSRSEDQRENLRERVERKGARTLIIWDKSLRSNQQEDLHNRAGREDSRRHLLRDEQERSRESSEKREEWTMENAALPKDRRADLRERINGEEARRFSTQGKNSQSHRREDSQDLADRGDSRRRFLPKEQERSRKFPERREERSMENIPVDRRLEKISRSKDQRKNEEREDLEDVRQLSEPEDTVRSNWREASPDNVDQENPKTHISRGKRERLIESSERQEKRSIEDVNRRHENLFQSEDQRADKELEDREVTSRREKTAPLDRRQSSGYYQIRRLEVRAEELDREDSNLLRESRERCEERRQVAALEDSRGNVFDRLSNKQRKDRSLDHRKDFGRVDQENPRPLNRQENHVDRNDIFEGLTKHADQEISRSQLLRERLERLEEDRREDSRERVDRENVRRDNAARFNRRENFRESQNYQLDERIENTDIRELRRHVLQERRERHSDSTQQREERRRDRLNRLSTPHEEDFSRSENQREDQEREDPENTRQLDERESGTLVNRRENSDFAHRDNLSRHIPRESRREDGRGEDSREREDSRRLDIREVATRKGKRVERLNSEQNLEIRERQEHHEGDDFMNYLRTIAKHSIPNLLTVIQGILLTAVIMKTLSFECKTLRNGFVFKAMELIGATDPLRPK